MMSKRCIRNFTIAGLITPLIIFLLAGCSTTPIQTQPVFNATEIFKSALLTATYAIKPSIITPQPPTQQPEATLPPLPTVKTPFVPRTPPPLPDIFRSDLLKKVDTPHEYITDTCQYLKTKWDPNNSAPGTIVMPIMFHSVVSDAVATLDNQITHETLVQLLDNLKTQGFEAISIIQLANFVYHNEKIPKRSVVLIVDDRHHEGYFRDNFEPQLKNFGWTMVNAWISHPSTTEDLWAENEKISKEGWVDYQAHGVVHNVAIENWAPSYPITTDIYGTLTAEQYIRKELNGSKEAIQQRFGKIPIAYIWPGGGFSELAVRLAREAGYQLGFTVNPRGPIMYNWIPLADDKDANRPSFTPEGKLNDPLLVLPRYWDVDASNQIDTVRSIGKEATAYANKNKATELDYYDAICKNITGEIPGLNP